MDTTPQGGRARRDGLPSDASGLVGAAVPPAGTPPPERLSRDLPMDRDLPDMAGPKPIPDPPASPTRLDRTERVSFPPVPRAPLPRTLDTRFADRRMGEPHHADGPYADARTAPPPSRKARINELEPEPDDGDLFPEGRHGRGQQPDALPYYGLPEPDEGTRTVPSFFEAVVAGARAQPEPVPEPSRKRARVPWLTLLLLPLLGGAVVALFYLQPTPWQTELLAPAAPGPALADAAPTPSDPVAAPPPGIGDSVVAEAVPAPPEVAPPMPEAPAEAAPATTQPAVPPTAVSQSAVSQPAVPAPAPPAPPPAPVAATADQYGPPEARFTSVVIRARATSAAERAEMGRIARVLQPMAGKIEMLTVQNTFRASTVRYFYPEDAAAAGALADELSRIGEPWRILAAQPQRPTPLGRLEVWVVEP